MAEMVTVNQFKKGVEKTANLVVDTYRTVAHKLQQPADSSNAGIMKLYTEAGEHTDGTMTQKAIKEALEGYVGETEFYISTLPTQSGKLTYTGAPLTPTWNNYDPLKLNISGTYENQIEPGTYTVGFTPYGRLMWTTGDQNTRSQTWTIDKAQGSFELSANSAEINASEDTSFTISQVGDGAISFEVADTDVATATINGKTITVHGVNRGSTTVSVSIDEGNRYYAPTDTKVFTINVTSIPMTLNATMATPSVMYNTQGFINVTGNLSGGVLGATSTNLAYVTIENTTSDTVTVKCNNCTTDTVRINISVPASGVYGAAYTHFDVVTAKSAGGFELSSYTGTIEIDSSTDVTVTKVGDGAITYNVANSDVATASLTAANTLTVVGKSAGTTAITVGVGAGTNNTAADSKTYNLTVKKIGVTLTTSTTLSEVTYNTSGVYNVTGNRSGGTIGATSTNTAFVTIESTTSSTVKVKCVGYSANPIPVNIAVGETEKYASSTAVINVTTAKANGSFTVAPTTGSMQVNATTQFTVDRIGDGTISTSGYDSDVVGVTQNANGVFTVTGKKYGTTNINVNVAAGTNHKAPTDTKTFAASVSRIPVNITSNKASDTVTYGATYTISVAGSTQILQATSANSDVIETTTATTNSVTVRCKKYSSTATRITITAPQTAQYESDTLTFDLATAKAAGTFTISSTAGTAYVDSTTTTFTVDKNGSDGAITFEYGDSSVASASISGNTVTVSGLKAGSTDITVKMGAGTNHLAATSTKKFTVTVNKVPVNLSLSLATSGAITYDTTRQLNISGNISSGTLTVSSSHSNYVTTTSVTTSTAILKCTKYTADTVTITVSSAGNNKYASDTKTITVTTAKAAGTLTLSATSGSVTYDSTTATFTVTNRTTNSTLSVETNTYVTAALSGTSITVTPVNCSVSSTKVKVWVRDTTGNFTDVSAEYTVTLNKHAGSVTLTGDSVSNNTVTLSRGSEVTVTYSATGTVGTPTSSATGIATVQKSGSNGLKFEGVETGTSTISIPIGASDNYTAITKTITVTVGAGVKNILSIPQTNTLAKLKSVIAAGNASNYFRAGDYFNITTIADLDTDLYTIPANNTWRCVCLGIDHNSSIEGTKRVHFCIGKSSTGRNTCFESKRMNSTDTTNGGWEACEMKTWLNDTFYNVLPTDLKNVITACTKYTNNSGSSKDSDAITATSQKIWIFTEYEIQGTIEYSNQYEQDKQAQYDYYKDGNSRVYYGHSSESQEICWLRSPMAGFPGAFCSKAKNGGKSINNASERHAFIPCFTIS